jgi:putative membrane protein
MKISYLLASATIAIALSTPALAADTAQDFVNKAAVGGMFEVESSQIAVSKTKDQTIKGFAEQMISDHGAANAKLKTIAGEQKLELPAGLDAKHKSNVDALNSAKDPVDASYVQMQREAHSEAVALFESYSEGGENAPLKAFATETLPTLKMHQEMVEKIAAGAPHDASTESSAKPGVAPTDTTGAVAPIAGANSFTEDQAKGRIEDAGFSEVTELKKDDQGVWRGQATRDGKKTPVALDYQGNVVAGTN